MEPNKPKTTAKDFFLHAAAMVLLYTSVGSLLTLLFNIINYKFPDVLSNSYYYYDPYTASMRFALAALIILFPVFLGLTYYINRELRREPVRREVAIRKWLLFLTVFLAAALLIGDLIALVHVFLNGEITTRFILKILAILVVGGFTFGYYTLDLRERYMSSPRTGHLFGVIAAIAVLASIVSGFLIIGSPSTARMIRFDEQKVQQLSELQWRILNYWQQKQKLPTNLMELNDSISGFTVPMDPQTGEAYEYEAAGALTFKLCATFNKDSSERRRTSRSGSVAMPIGAGIKGENNWEHGVGRVCFDRTIDPELYRPYKPVQ